MKTQDKINLVRERFIHQPETYAIMRFDPERGTEYKRVTNGHCPNIPPCPKKTCEHIEWIPITDQLIYQHLKGEKTIGTYQLTDDNTVRWLCLDVDGQKNTGVELSVVQEHTKQLARMFIHYVGRRILVERSGDKGYHIWLFFDGTVQARHAHALAHFVDNQLNKPEHIGVEIFPKQVHIDAFGNLVKVPLGIHARTKERCLFVNANFEPYEDQFALLSNVSLMTEAELVAVIEAHNMRVPSSIRIEANQNNREVPCMRNIMHEGLGEGARDDGTFYVGNYLRTKNMPYDMAYAAVQVMNNRARPPLDEYTLGTKIQSAFSGDYSPYPCGRINLDEFCSSSCRLFDYKVRNRGMTREEAIGKISRD